MKKYFLILSLVIAGSSHSYGCNHFDFEDISKSMVMSSSVVATYQDASTQTIYKDVAVQADEEIEYLTGKQMEWELLPYVRCMGTYMVNYDPKLGYYDHVIQYIKDDYYNSDQQKALAHSDKMARNSSGGADYYNFHTYPCKFYIQTLREFNIPSIFVSKDKQAYLDDYLVTKIKVRQYNLPIETDSITACSEAIDRHTYSQLSSVGQSYIKQSALFITDPAFPIKTTFEEITKL